MIRNLVLLSAVLLGTNAFATKLELEIGAGAATAATTTPALTARIGVDFLDHLTPSLRALAVATPSGREGLAGYETWALLAELRAHTAGTVQLTAGLGMGIGRINLAPTPSVAGQLDGPGAYLAGDLGVRVMVQSLWVALGITASPSRALFAPLGHTVSYDGSSLTWLGTLSLGWAAIESR